MRNNIILDLCRVSDASVSASYVRTAIPNNRAIDVEGVC